jgi:hypothetical protein
MKPRHRLIALKEITDARGKLVFAQDGDHIPFPVRRIFMLYDMPEGATRGGHAHRAQHQLLMMMSGACTAGIDDGAETVFVTLDRPNQLLYAPPMLWLDLKDFTSGAVCAVLVSGLYDEADYIREQAEFRRLASAPR